MWLPVLDSEWGASSLAANLLLASHRMLRSREIEEQDVGSSNALAPCSNALGSSNTLTPCILSLDEHITLCPSLDEHIMLVVRAGTRSKAHRRARASLTLCLLLLYAISSSTIYVCLATCTCSEKSGYNNR